MPDLITQEGFPFAFRPSACHECGGRCCTGESGNIFVSRGEIEALAAFLDLEPELFASRYLEKRGYKYSLIEQRFGDSHDCIFFDRTFHGCSVYGARPLQCRSFPFWDYFKSHPEALRTECPGVVDV